MEQPLRGGRRVGEGDSALAKDNSSLCEVEWRELEIDGVAYGDAGEVASKMTRDMGEDGMSVGELDAEFVTRQHGGHGSRNFNLVVVQHGAAKISKIMRSHFGRDELQTHAWLRSVRGMGLASEVVRIFGSECGISWTKPSPLGRAD